MSHFMNKNLRQYKRVFSIFLTLIAMTVVGVVFAAKAKPKAAKAKPKAVVKAPAKPALTALQILDRVDKNSVFETRKTMVTMKIHKRGRTRVKKMKAYSKGEEVSYMEFLSPARDKGVKYLKKKDNLWMYLPSAEKVVKISGHMLRQSMMGSDFSYEDMMDSQALRSRYHVKVLKSEKFQGRDCYVLELNQKKPGQTFPKRRTWIDKEYFVALRSENFAASGRLLKYMEMSGIKKYGTRYYATNILLKDKLRKGTWTKMSMDKIEFKIALPGQVFSLRNLQRE